jgi:cytochrome oxidase Cu insertion factor (SCO1/SenC/PrrC family)
LASSLAVAALAAGPAASAGPPRAQAPQVAHTTLKAGDVAPDFTLLDNHWKPVHLSDFRGKKNVVLAFYVLAFTGG